MPVTAPEGTVDPLSSRHGHSGENSGKESRVSFQIIPGVPHFLISTTCRFIQDGVISEVLKTS